MKTQKGSLVVNENLISVDRSETEQLLSQVEASVADQDHEKILVPFHGLAGAGKTFIAREVCRRLKENKTYENLFSAYVDLSDCADEVTVYYKIALQEKAFLERMPAIDTARMKEAVKQFLTIYGWIYGSEITPAPEPSLDKIREAAGILKEEIDKHILKKAEDSQGSSKFDMGSLSAVYDILCKVADKIPYVKLISAIAQVKVQYDKAIYMKHLMEEVAEAFSVHKTREILLRNLLVYALTGKDVGSGVQQEHKIYSVIILDNFQLTQSNDLGRDHTWLSEPGGLISMLDAVWVIIGRNEIRPHFEGIFAENGYICEEIVLGGLNKEKAEQYVRNNCKKWDGAEDEDYDAIVDRILEVCGFRETVQCQREEVKYLPYLLRLLVLYYQKLLADPTCTITREAFAKLKSREEFFGYYFYKDLSDLMINAFQILSCIMVWDPVWIGIVRERFDNHLLNAKNVLFHTAPMEELGDGRFKLHEAVKDGLYNSTQNYIKQDVLEYLFECFIQIYSSDRTKDNLQIWYEAERMNTFMEVVAAYLQEIGEEGKSKIKELQPVMKKLQEYHHTRENVNDSFIRVYTKYIDTWKGIWGIPFVELGDYSFGNVINFEEYRDEIDMLFQNTTLDHDIWEKMWEEIPDYMEACMDLADLYTDNSQTDVAYQIEGLCLTFWQKMKDFYAGTDTLKHYKCRQRTVKAYNAFAYDLSAEHAYEHAFMYGSKGMQEMKSLAEELIAECEDLTDHEKDILKIILAPENSEKFWVNDQMEISADLFQSMVALYKKIIVYDSKEDTVMKILVDLLKNYLQLRGNYFWYVLNMKERPDHLTDEEGVLFGVRTYWMRKALAQAHQELLSDTSSQDKKELNRARRNMETSHHNICVYLYKTGRIQEACLLEHEVIEDSKNLLPHNKNAEQMQKKLEDILKNDESDNVLFRYLCNQQALTEESRRELCNMPPQMMEQLQFMGDYYLHMKHYTSAFRYLSKVMLWRGIQNKATDSKLLDTTIRLFVTSFALGQEVFEQVKLHVENLLKRQEGLENLSQPAAKEGQIITSKGIRDKLDCLGKLLRICEEEYMDQAGRNDMIERMLDIVDGKESGGNEEGTALSFN